jgi:tryptophan halogenase
MAPRPPNDGLPPAPEAGRLAAFAKGLGCDVGIERSCKLSPGRVESGRFLLSYGADERTARLTGRLLRDLAFPPALEGEFGSAAAEARFLHLGYEAGPRGPLLKAYCEGEPEGRGRPLYTAFKWRAPGAWSIDDYWLRDAGDAGAAAPFIKAAFGADLDALSGGCVALAEANDGEEAGLMLLEVERRGASRRSFDLRLYGGSLTLADARALAGAADRAFALDGRAWAALEPEAGRELGHLSGGRDDAGAPFLTLYYGARAFA